MIIDVHTHAFPDFLAPKAMAKLTAAFGEYELARDGTLASLLDSMDRAGVTLSFLANIATRPEQGPAILEWARNIATDRIIPLGSIHPHSKTWPSELEAIAEAGFPGIKFHAQYQSFAVDDDAMLPIYETAARLGLFVLFHGGYDIAFPGDDSSSPRRLAKVSRRVEGLHMIAAHVGGWMAWPEVVEHLLGTDVYLDLSYLHELTPADFELIVERHAHARLLFGSDTPWISQRSAIEVVRRLPLAPPAIERILGQNALALHPTLVARLAHASTQPQKRPRAAITPQRDC
jgi:predicted TIM-barrel fold metal-dependent hydrolase